MKFIKQCLLSAVLFCSFEALAIPNFAKMDNQCARESLSKNDAIQRFEWLKKCHPEFIKNYYDVAWGNDPISFSEKIDLMEDELLYDRQGRERSKPDYFSFVDSNYNNPEKFFAPVRSSEECIAIPSSYSKIVLCRV